MSVCVAVSEDGEARVVAWNEKQIAAYLDNRVHFVGALDDLNLVIVASRSGQNTHAWHAKASPLFLQDSPPRGNIVFVGSDANGMEQDVDVDALRSALRAQYGVTF